MYFIMQCYYKTRHIYLIRKGAQIRRRLVEAANRDGLDGEWLAAFMDEMAEKELADGMRQIEEYKQQGHDAREVNRFIRELIAKNA